MGTARTSKGSPKKSRSTAAATAGPRRARAKPKSKTTTSPRASTATPSPADALQVLFARTRNALPEPGPVLRRGFALLHSDDECAQLGNKTRADEVLPEAREALLSVAEVIVEHGAALRFRPTRLRYAMELVSELELAVARQREGERSGRGRASALVLAETEAAQARSAMLRALGPIVSAGGDAEREAFEQARGNLRDKDLLASLTELIALGQRWAHGDDEVLAALAEHQGLSPSALTSYEEAARSLASAREQSAQGGPTRPQDIASTNVLEGRVLFEVKALYDAIDDNRPSTAIALPKLGATLRRVLFVRGGKKSDTEKGERPAPEPKKGPADDTARRDERKPTP